MRKGGYKKSKRSGECLGKFRGIGLWGERLGWTKRNALTKGNSAKRH